MGYWTAKIDGKLAQAKQQEQYPNATSKRIYRRNDPIERKEKRSNRENYPIERIIQ